MLEVRPLIRWYYCRNSRYSFDWPWIKNNKPRYQNHQLVEKTPPWVQRNGTQPPPKTLEVTLLKSCKCYILMLHVFLVLKWHLVMKWSNNLLWSHHYICRIQAVGSMFPKYGVAITRETSLNLKSNARKTEAGIFSKASSRVGSNF